MSFIVRLTLYGFWSRSKATKKCTKRSPALPHAVSASYFESDRRVKRLKAIKHTRASAKSKLAMGRARARQRRLALRDLLRRLRGAIGCGARGPEGRPRRAARRRGDAPGRSRGERRRLRGVALQGLARLRQEGRRRGLIASIPPSPGEIASESSRRAL